MSLTQWFDRAIDAIESLIFQINSNFTFYHLVAGEVVGVGEVLVVDEDLAVEAGAPGHAHRHVGVVPVAIKLACTESDSQNYILY